MKTATIFVAGTGRMGKGIALAFASAGIRVILADSEDRSDSDFNELKAKTLKQLAAELEFLQSIDVISTHQLEAAIQRILIVNKTAAADEAGRCNFIFEAVLELIEVKQAVYTWLNGHIHDRAIISSTTSTISANDLAACVTLPARFVNAHWLNPAHLMPLVEVSPGDMTSQSTVYAMRDLLAEIGKVSVVCKASPGFIVARIQALAMNEAARIVEEGVATAEDVDQAIKAGFGIRYASLGLLEFIDWGGGDILYHATRYLGENLDPARFSVPRLVVENMKGNRNGLRDGVGFYDWQNCDIESYRRRIMTEFIQLLQHKNLMPRYAMDDPENSTLTGD